MRPIPKVLLIHAVTLQEVTEKDSWGNEVLGEPVELDRIRLEPTTKYVRDKQNNEIQLAAVLFYDCKNSRPRNQGFIDSQVVMFHGERYKVQLVEPFYDGHRLHHYEVGLIRYA